MNQTNQSKKELLDEIQFLKKENALLKENKEIFQIITENTDDNISITTFDLKAKYIYVSPSVTRSLGYEPQELLGKSFFSFIHPDDKNILFPILKKYIKLVINKMLRVAKPYTSETIEFRFMHKNGHWHYMQSTINFFGSNLLAITRDISKQKKIELDLKTSESRYRSLFNGINDAVFVHPLKSEGFGHFHEVNDIACQRLGYTREELLKLSPKGIGSKSEVDKRGNKTSRK